MPTRKIAIVSQKGGVGKTSLAQNLGSELAKLGQQVLLLDFDPQSNLTIGCGLDPAKDRPTIYNLMIDPAQATSCILRLGDNLSLIPANLDLSGAETHFSDPLERPHALSTGIGKISANYDLILIDAPPSLGFFTVNSLVAANEFLIPLQVHPYAYKAIDQLLDIVKAVRRRANTTLKPTGIVLTMYDSRNSLTRTIERAARGRFKDSVFRTIIPVNVRIAEAPLSGKSVADYDTASRGAQAYRELAQEVLDRAK